MTPEEYIEKKVTTIYSGGINAVRVVSEEDALSAIDLARKETSDKALEWIKTNIRPYYSEVKYHYDDFVKAMEE